MEFNLGNNRGQSERIRWGYSSSAEEIIQVRSYTCDFCQKGFSNAQALGGHMNIHRRDRARLRQQYCQENINLLSLDTTNPNNNDDDDDLYQKKPSIFPEAKVNNNQIPIFFGVEEKKMELDLELRLGPIPVKQTPPILRRFF